MISVSAVCLALLVSSLGCDEVSARRRVQDGSRHYKNEKYEEAAAKFEEAVKLKPDLAIAWWNLAVTHIDLYRPGDKAPANEAHATRAIEALNTYIELEPEDEQAVKMLIGVYMKSGRYEGALEYFQKQFDKNPKDTYVIAQLADINETAKRWDESRRWFKILGDTEEKPEQKSVAWTRVGVSYWKQVRQTAGLKSAERAKLADAGIAAMLRADQIMPNSPNTLIFTNLLYRERALSQGKSYYQIVDVATSIAFQKRAQEAKAKQAAEQPPALPGQGPAPAGNQK